jgi:predicted YcjX-like family ATPase
MTALPAIDMRSSNAQLDVTAIASVISTAEDSQMIDGQRVQVVLGRPVGAKTQSKFFVGNVPIRPPRPDAWGSPFLNVPVFEPPTIGLPRSWYHTSTSMWPPIPAGDRLR